jgi:small subunit ribosomal protein S16
MIKLRLKRYGKKREASYRIVAMKSTDRRDGRPLEELGFYNPRTDEVRLNAEAITKRLQEGAQPTDTVRHILEKQNLIEKKPRPQKNVPQQAGA